MRNTQAAALLARARHHERIGAVLWKRAVDMRRPPR